MTLDNYLECQRIFAENTNTDDFNSRLNVIAYLDETTVNDLRNIPLGNIVNRINEITELFNTLHEARELHEIEVEGAKWKIDASVMQASVALYADYSAIINKFTGFDRLKPILSLLIFKEGESAEYSFERYLTNMKRVGELDIKNVMLIINFFLQLLNVLQNASQIYSEATIQLNQDLKELSTLTELSTTSMKGSTLSTV